MAMSVVDVLHWQAKFLARLDKVFGLVGGLGSGKTFIVCNWFIDRCMEYPEGTHIVVGRDLPQLKLGTLESLKNALTDRGIDYNYNQTSGSITILENGCIIEAKGALNFQGFRSLEADTIWCDELADWGPSGEVAFTQYVVPRLRASPGGKKYHVDNGGTMIEMLRFSSNPPLSTLHWLYQLIVVKKFCECMNVSLYDNHLMGPRLKPYIKLQQAAMAPALWPILIEGKWGNATVGHVYSCFDRLKHGAPPPLPLHPMAYNPRLPILWTLDFNVGLMCSVICQMHIQERTYNGQLQPIPGVPVQYMSEYMKPLVDGYQDSILYILREIRMPNAGSPNVVAEFSRIYREQGWRQKVVLYGDASGSNRGQTMDSAEAARSNWAIIYRALVAANIPVEVRIQTANPGIIDRVNAVNARLGTVPNNQGLFINLKDAEYTAVDLETVDWDKKGQTKFDTSNPLLTHLSDAVGYLCWVEQQLSYRQPVNMKSVMDL